MKKRILAVVLCLCFLMALIPMTVSAQSAKTYLALGDSISGGYGLANLDESFPNLLAKELGSDYILVDKSTNEGETTASLWADLQTEEFRTAVKNANIITVTIGGNDLIASLFQFVANELGMEVDALKDKLAEGDLEVVNAAAKVINENDFMPAPEEIEAVAENYKKIMAEINSINPYAILVSATQYSPYEELAIQLDLISWYLDTETKELANAIIKLSKTVDKVLAAYNPIIEESNGDYLVADVYTLFHESKKALRNATLVPTKPVSVNLDFHPNKKGHEEIATIMKKTLPGSVTVTTEEELLNAVAVNNALEIQIAGSFALNKDMTTKIPIEVTNSAALVLNGCEVNAKITVREGATLAFGENRAVVNGLLISEGRIDGGQKETCHWIRSEFVNHGEIENAAGIMYDYGKLTGEGTIDGTIKCNIGADVNKAPSAEFKRSKIKVGDTIHVDVTGMIDGVDSLLIFNWRVDGEKAVVSDPDYLTSYADMGKKIDLVSVKLLENENVKYVYAMEESCSDALVWKGDVTFIDIPVIYANYNEVDEAIAEAQALDKELYQNFAMVYEAVNAVVRGKDITEQPTVDAMAKRIKDAIASLVEKAEEKPTDTPTDRPSDDVPDSPVSPETGDYTNITLYVILMLLSGLAIAVISVLEKEKRRA